MNDGLDLFRFSILGEAGLGVLESVHETVACALVSVKRIGAIAVFADTMVPPKEGLNLEKKIPGLLISVPRFRFENGPENFGHRVIQ